MELRAGLHRTLSRILLIVNIVNVDCVLDTHGYNHVTQIVYVSFSDFSAESNGADVYQAKVNTCT